MTWRTWIWRGAFLVWFMVLAAPMLVLVIPINVMDDQTGSDRLVGNFLLVGAFLLVVPMHTWITIRAGTVRFGFFPLYWKMLSISEIRYAIAVEFQPMRDFGGWGLKGLAKSRNGILLGGNPSRGLMIETLDRRRYILSFTDAEPVLRALAEQGCAVLDAPPTINTEEVGT